MFILYTYFMFIHVCAYYDIPVVIGFFFTSFVKIKKPYRI